MVSPESGAPKSRSASASDAAAEADPARKARRVKIGLVIVFRWYHRRGPGSLRRPGWPCKARVACLILVMDSYTLYDWYISMTRLNVTKAREAFPDVINRAAHGKERTIVSHRGKDLAAVIPIEDLRLLERLTREEMDRIDIEDARAALKEAEEKGTIPLRDLMRELGD